MMLNRQNDSTNPTCLRISSLSWIIFNLAVGERRRNLWKYHLACMPHISTNNFSFFPEIGIRIIGSLSVCLLSKLMQTVRGGTASWLLSQC